MKQFYPLALAATALVGPSLALGAGNTFNPDTSVNFLTLYKNATNGNDNGFHLQEAELQFAADVDPYFRASAMFSVAKDDGRWGIEPEEVYAETTSLPVLTLKGGRFRAAIGRHNQMHTHAFPFIDAPLINQHLLGDDGYADEGASVAALLPTPWFSELTAQVFSGHSTALFDSARSDDVAGVFRLKNLWDLSESTTLEFGLSGATGRNGFSGRTSVFGADLTLKHRPVVGGKYTGLVWSFEYLYGDREGRADTGPTLADLRLLSGMSTWLQYNFAERWWVQGRYDLVGLQPTGGLNNEQRESALVAYVLSEFSELRLQYDHTLASDRTHLHSVALQLNISIGAHPAHAY